MEMSVVLPFICPYCDDDYWVKAEQDSSASGEFDCPNCTEEVSLSGGFEAVKADV